MRQSGICLLFVGMVLAVSCSNDHLDADIETMPITETNNNLTLYGTFEGDWRLGKYGQTCRGTIEVDSGKIKFDLPMEYLFPKLGLATDKTQAAYPNDPLFDKSSELTFSDIGQIMQYSVQGYSSDAQYLTTTDIDNQTAPYGFNDISFNVKANDVKYRIGLSGIKDETTAVFDYSTGLWTLAIPIDKITISNNNTNLSVVLLDDSMPENSAWLFVFRANRKIE